MDGIKHQRTMKIAVGDYLQIVEYGRFESTTYYRARIGFHFVQFE